MTTTNITIRMDEELKNNLITFATKLACQWEQQLLYLPKPYTT